MPATSVTRRHRRDAGQTLPIYVVAIGGLLFLALAFFAVGQAAATRNGAQTAADAAALAAGQKYRDDLRKGFLDELRGGLGAVAGRRRLAHGEEGEREEEQAPDRDDVDRQGLPGVAPVAARDGGGRHGRSVGG